MQLANDGGRVCHDGQPIPLIQATGKLIHRGASLKKHSLAVQHQMFSLARDRLLLSAMAVRQSLIGRLEVGAGHAGNRSPMRTDQYAIVLQGRQVSPHGRGRNPKSGAEVGSGNSALTGKNLSNAKSTLFCEHECLRSPGWLSLVPIGGSAAQLYLGCERFVSQKVSVGDTNRSETNNPIDKRASVSVDSRNCKVTSCRPLRRSAPDLPAYGNED